MIKQAKTANEVLAKYEKAERHSPAWERPTFFSWKDMILLRDRIIELELIDPNNSAYSDE